MRVLLQIIIRASHFAIFRVETLIDYLIHDSRYDDDDVPFLFFF
jgi:hypothetical protein